MSSSLTQRGSIDAESEMLPQDPPPSIIRFTGWLLIALFLFGLLMAIVLKLPGNGALPLCPGSRDRR